MSDRRKKFSKIISGLKGKGKQIEGGEGSRSTSKSVEKPEGSKKRKTTPIDKSEESPTPSTLTTPVSDGRCFGIPIDVFEGSLRELPWHKEKSRGMIVL